MIDGWLPKDFGYFYWWDATFLGFLFSIILSYKISLSREYFAIIVYCPQLHKIGPLLI